MMLADDVNAFTQGALPSCVEEASIHFFETWRDSVLRELVRTLIGERAVLLLHDIPQDFIPEETEQQGRRWC